MRIKGSYLWAAAMVAAIGGWLATGELIVGGQGDGDGDAQAPVRPAVVEEQQPVTVRVRRFLAEQRQAELTVRARTEADARVRVKAETRGLVEAMPFAKGAEVQAGDVVCRIEEGARQARVLRTEAQVAQAQLDYDAAAQLKTRGFAAETRVRALKAALDAARAELAEAKLDIDRTQLKAPFSGILDEENAEIGDFLDAGMACVTIVAADPMLVVGQVSEREVGLLRTGMSGTAKLVTGETVDGRLRYIATTAAAETRTFRIELEVPNPGGTLRDGVTAELKLPLAPQRAHRFSPAILTLNDAGQIGVRMVDEQNIVQFVPVEVLSMAPDAVWVAGLPEAATLITVGQEYVADGEAVRPVFATAQSGTAGSGAGASDQGASQ